MTYESETTVRDGMVAVHPGWGPRGVAPRCESKRWASPYSIPTCWDMGGHTLMGGGCG